MMENGTGGGGRRTWKEIARISLERNDRQKTVTWSHVFDVHSCDVLAEEDDDEIAKKLNTLISTCSAWRDEIYRRKRSVTERTCIARVPDNGDNIACGKTAIAGDFCAEHAHT